MSVKYYLTGESLHNIMTLIMTLLLVESLERRIDTFQRCGGYPLTEIEFKTRRIRIRTNNFYQFLILPPKNIVYQLLTVF